MTFPKLWLVALFVGVSLTVPAHGETYAVFVGINQFVNPGVRALQFAEDDARLMHDSLIRSVGLKPENAKLLLGAEAKRENIAVAVKGWLAERAKPEDAVLFYYAGHGLQLPDNNGDEEDGLDECLLAQDSILLDITLIRDDDLNRWLSAVPAKERIVILDCCHSGTGSRVTEGVTVRSAEIRPSDVRLSSMQANLRTERSIDEAIRGTGVELATTTMDDLEVSLPEDIGYELAGCLPNQVTVEAQALKHGALTYFMSEGLGGLADANGNGAITLKEIREYAQRELRRRNYPQDPQLYGTGAEEFVLARVAPKPAPTKPPAPKRARKP